MPSADQQFTEQGMPGRSLPGQLLDVEGELACSAPLLFWGPREPLLKLVVAADAVEERASSRSVMPSSRTVQTGQTQQPKAATAREDESGTDTDEDGELIRAKAKAAQEKAAAKPAVKRRAPGDSSSQLPRWKRFLSFPVLPLMLLHARRQDETLSAVPCTASDATAHTQARQNAF